MRTFFWIGLAFQISFQSGAAFGAQVNQVEVLGVQSISREEVSASVEVYPGEDLSNDGLQRSTENLKRIYRIRGYLDTDVKVIVDKKKILQFIVTEGKPSILQNLEFEVRSQRPDFQLKQLPKILTEIRAKSDFKVGDNVDEEQLNSVRKAVLDVLASYEFVGAQVLESKITKQGTLDAPKVDVKIIADTGDRVTFGFRGNEAISKSELLALIEDQRQLGLGQEFIRDIATRIREQYLSMGYSQVSIEPFLFQSEDKKGRHITFVIQEGIRARIDSIFFDGNLTFSSKELEAKLKELASPAVQSGFYVEKVIESAAERMTEWLKSQGFLGAKLLSVSKASTGKADRVRVNIYLYEGEPTLVHSVQYQGLNFMKTEEVTAILGLNEGMGLNLFAFNEGIEVLKQNYRAAGFLDFRVVNENAENVVRYTDENRRADIGLIFEEGPRYRIESVTFTQTGIVDSDIIQREILYKEEDVVEEARLSQTESQLRRTGVFSGVKTRLEPGTRSGYKKIFIDLVDGTPGVVGGGIGFRNDLGVRLFGQSSYGNLWNRNHTVFLNATTNKRYRDFKFIEYQAQLGYQWPWFLNLPEVTYRPRVTAEKTQYRKFGVSSVAFGSTWERLLLKRPLLTGLFTYNLERIRQFETGVELDPIDNQTLRIGSITPALRLDMRDNALAPTRGIYSSLSYEYADPIFLSQSEPFPIGYHRIQFRTDGHIPIGGGTLIYMSFRTGYERNNKLPANEDPNNPDKRFQIPLVKQFTLGGVGSLRGFDEQELNFQDFAVRGTLSYVNYRVQVDLPFAGALKFGPFLDAGNLLIDRYSFGNLRYGTGAGFHYLTPIGPVNFDWGVKIDPRPGEDPSFFYFSIGVI